ncbi:MAG: S8 family serine peptidase [Bacteroides sp.]|nr:S8 family serine peptidase [Bacteroides sp.]
MGHPDVIVAIVDAGIQHNHPDLADNIWINKGEVLNNGRDDDGNGYIDDYYGYNFYDNTGNIVASDHGTHVAGTIGAVNNNNIGVSGIAGGNKALNQKGVRLMDCKVAHHQTGYLTTNTALVAKVIKYGADNGAVISQNSWGSNSTHMQEAVNYFIANAGINKHGVQTGPMRGGIVIAAAGNENSQSMRYPAALSNVIAVTSIGPDFKKAYYSNYGSWTDIAAPGGNMNLTGGGVYSTLAGGKYGYMQGTSMACPHVSGIAALVLSKAIENGTSVSMTPEILKEILLSACSSHNLNYYNPGFYLGEGLIDVNFAVSRNTSFPTVTPIIIGPDGLVEGEWETFRLDWGDFYHNDYTWEWGGYALTEVHPETTGISVSARSFNERGQGEVFAIIRGKYNGYYKRISKHLR